MKNGRVLWAKGIEIESSVQSYNPEGMRPD